ncbi:MAG: pitrilysin family protein [Candidatus Hydrothermales bacterium]
MLKRIYKAELENKIKILYVKNKELPIISFAIGFDTGSYLDPKGKEGLFYLTSNLIDKGNSLHSSYKIRDFFDGIGAKFNIVTSKNLLIVKLLCRVEYFSKIADFLEHILYYPSFDEREIEKEKRTVISEILQEEEEPDYLVSKKFYEVLYKDTPLSHPIDGYIHTIKEIEKKDIENFYKEKILGRKIFIAGSGYLDFDEFLNKFEKLFRNYKILSNFYPEFRKERTDRRILVIKKKVNQVFVRVGHFSLKRKDKNFHYLILSNYILGGGAFASRLFKKIRNELGFVYSIYSKFNTIEPFVGSYSYLFQTSEENFEKAFKKIIHEIKKFKVKGATMKELKDAKGFYKGSILREFETYSQITNLLISSLQYGLRYSYVFETLKKILSTKIEDLNTFIKNFYDYENLSGVILVPDRYDFSFLKEILPQHSFEVL